MYYRKNGTPIIEETFEKSMSDTKNEDSSDEFLSPIMKCFILFWFVFFVSMSNSFRQVDV